MSFRFGPRTSRIAMKKPSSVFPESNTVTMFGWSIFAWI